MALTGAVASPHLRASKDQAVALGGVAPGAMQRQTTKLGGVLGGLQDSRRARKTGQLRDGGRGKHRASRRAGRLG